MTKLSNICAAALGVTLALAPVSGFAKDNHNKGNGHGRNARVETQPVVIDGPVVIDREVRRARVQQNVVIANCPPGLAKKNPPCVPPGQARKYDRDHDRDYVLRVGDVLDWDNVHIVNQPGLYGLGNPPDGNRYAIVDGRLVRVESETGRLLSIIRLVNAILD